MAVDGLVPCNFKQGDAEVIEKRDLGWAKLLKALPLFRAELAERAVAVAL